MNLLAAIEEKCETPPDWDNVFATVAVTNSIATNPEEIRGLVTLSIGNNELHSTYFGEICQEVREYENLAEFKINTNVGVKQGLRQFISSWPNELVLVGTNVDGWLRPLMLEAGKTYELFGDHKITFLDLGRFASATRLDQIHPDMTMAQVLPQNKFRGRAGALGRLADAVDVHQNSFSDAVNAEKRVRTIAAVLCKHLERELEEDSE